MSFMDTSFDTAGKWTLRRILKYVFLTVLILSLLPLVFTTFLSNEAGHVMVRQAFIFGDLMMRWEPGLFFNMWADYETYPLETSYKFSRDESEENIIGPAIEVRFNDGGTALISGDVRFRLPQNDSDMVLLHQTFGSADEVMKEIYMQTVRNSVYNAAALMSSEESYTTKKAQFSQYARDQLEHGLFETEEVTQVVLDTLKKTKEERKFVRVKTDTSGFPLRQKALLKEYSVAVVQFTLREPWYDSTIIELISKKREYRNDAIVAEANADKARQEKLTVIANGEKNRTEAEFKAKTEMAQTLARAVKDSSVTVTQAQQQLDVAIQEYEQTKASADAAIALAQGEADRRKKNLAANNALEPRLIAYKEILGFYQEALKHCRLSPDVTTTSAFGAGSAPMGISLMEAIDEQVRKDLGLELIVSVE